VPDTTVLRRLQLRSTFHSLSLRSAWRNRPWSYRRARRGGRRGQAPRSTQKYARDCLCLPPYTSARVSLPTRLPAWDRRATPAFSLVQARIGLLRPSACSSWELASQRRGRRFKSDHLHPENRLVAPAARRFCWVPFVGCWRPFASTQKYANWSGTPDSRS